MDIDQFDILMYTNMLEIDIFIDSSQLAVMGQVLPGVRLRRQNLDQSHVFFPLLWAPLCFHGHPGTCPWLL